MGPGALLLDKTEPSQSSLLAPINPVQSPGLSPTQALRVSVGSAGDLTAAWLPVLALTPTSEPLRCPWPPDTQGGRDSDHLCAAYFCKA